MQQLIRGLVRTLKLRLSKIQTHKVHCDNVRHNSTQSEWRGVYKIRLMKGLFALTLFGGSLTAAIIVRKNKNKEWKEILQHSRRLQGMKFGDHELYKIGNFVLAEPILRIWKQIESFHFRNDDILLMSFPKTGVTWVQEIVWLLMNQLNYDGAKSVTITERFPYLEFISPGIGNIEKQKSPRLIKTHLPPSLLFSDKKNGDERPKVIAIFRNPKDCLVSYYHFCRMNNMIGFKGNFQQFFERFIDGTVPYGPFWEHFLDVINYRDKQNDDTHAEHHRILILFYEDLKNDFSNQIDRICEFLEKPKLNDNEMQQLSSHCSFDNMKLNPSVNYSHWDDFGLRDKNEAHFMRKGQIGDWKNYLNVDQNIIIDKLINEKIQNKISFIYV